MSNEPSFTLLDHLLDEVEVPSDGTLSRVVFSGSGLRVVLFAFDTGEQLTDHTATVPAVIQVVQGRLALTLGAHEAEVGPGSWVHMEAHLTHAVVALEPTVMILTLLQNA